MESQLQSRFRKLNGKLRSLAAVNVRTIAEEMWSTEDLNLDELDTIKTGGDGCSAASKLLECVYRRGDKSIKGFVQALRKIEMFELADELDSEGPSLPLSPAPEQLSTPHSCSAPAATCQHQHFCFDAASAIIPLPILCHDLALTKDGRILLAAEKHGLIEVCLKTKKELSRWRPPMQSFLFFFAIDDKVTAVAALSDGRAAVCLCFAQLVVLLRRSEEGRKGGANLAGYSVWTEDHRFHKLPWEPSLLSTQGDLLAVARGRELHLMRNNRGRWLTSEVHRQYYIDLMLVSDQVLVTGCRDPGTFFVSGSVLDGHSMDDLYRPLWQYKVEGTKRIQSICADSTGRCLYAAVWIPDYPRSEYVGDVWFFDRLSTLSLVDGSELRRQNLASECATFMPERLSLLEYGTTEKLQEKSSNSSSTASSRSLLLAVLYWERSKQLSGICGSPTVAVHRSDRCVTESPL